MRYLRWALFPVGLFCGFWVGSLLSSALLVALAGQHALLAWILSGFPMGLLSIMGGVLTVSKPDHRIAADLGMLLHLIMALGPAIYMFLDPETARAALPGFADPTSNLLASIVLLAGSLSGYIWAKFFHDRKASG
jgi:hypothetical protein